MAAWGITRDMLPKDPLDEEPEAFLVYPENWETVMLFLRLQTQWKLGAMGGWIGLDYQGMEAMLRMLRVKDRAVMFDNLQAMELAALPVLNERTKK